MKRGIINISSEGYRQPTLSEGTPAQKLTKAPGILNLKKNKPDGPLLQY